MKPLTAFAALAIASTALVGCDFKQSPENIAGLRCITETRNLLRDPDSYRGHGQERMTTADNKRVRVLLTYSGENAFGGRVRHHNVCIYNMDELTS